MYIRSSTRPAEMRTRVLMIVGSIIVVVVVALQFFVPYFLPALFTSIARPFWRMEFSIASGSLQSPQALLAENEALKRTLQDVMIQNQSAAQIQTENDEILKAFGRTGEAVNSSSTAGVSMSSSSALATTSASSTTENAALTKLINRIDTLHGTKYVLAAVLKKPPLVAYDELIVDAGKDQGVVPGAKVYGPGNILIGTTTEVLAETSKVLLLSSPGQTYPVLIGPNHVQANAVGRGGGQYGARIPQATKIARGDSVEDSTLSDGQFGIVTDIISNPADPYETVLFSVPVNIYELRWVILQK